MEKWEFGKNFEHSLISSNQSIKYLIQFFKDKTRYSTLTRMSYCQCRLKLVFARIFREFNFEHVALLLDRSDLFSLTVGKNLEYGLKEEGVLKFVRELSGNELLREGHLNKSDSERQMKELQTILRDASMYARVIILSVRGQLVRLFMLAAHEWVSSLIREKEFEF